MKLLFASLVFLLAVVAAGEYWALRQRAEEFCHTARALARHGASVAAWAREAAGDPYLGEASLRGPPNGIFALYREQSRRISAEVSTRFLPESTIEAFRRLSVARGGGPELATALEALAPASASLSCREPASPTEGDELTRLVDAAGLFWAERRAVSRIEKEEFAHDRSIFCHGEDLLRKLRAVVDAAGEACRNAKPGSKLARSCGAKVVEGKGSVETEVQDLEREKDLNLRKLRQKWPAAVLEGLQC